MSNIDARSELKWVFVIAVAVVLLSSIPYLWGILLTGNGERFMGLTHNIDDGAVYLSWMRQASDGHFFIRNLFTSEPQVGKQFNVLFLVMGNFARLTHLPLIWVYHLFRVLLGVLLIIVLWRFAKLFLPEPTQRLLFVGLVGFSSGIGWLLSASMQGPPNGSVDMWQSESITFLSIYLNPLFVAALILMVCAFHELILAEREGSVRHAVYAGLWLLILGNVHTYDVVTITCVWITYLIALTIANRKFPARTVQLSLLAAVIALPSVGYQLWLYHSDTVLYARANSPIPSPPVWSFFMGYGLVFIGAIAGVVIILRRIPSFITHNSRMCFGISNPETTNSKLIILPIVWSIVGFIVPYCPIAQQRKLIMGVHIPLCILCAYSMVWLLRRARRIPSFITHNSKLIILPILPVVLLMGQSNMASLRRDIGLLAQGSTVTHFLPYMTTDDMAAMRWLHENTKWNDTILAPPTFSLFAPAMIGHQVYYGHWSETPDYGDKMKQCRDLLIGIINEEVTLDALLSIPAKYYVLPFVPEANVWSGKGLRQVFARGSIVIYKAAR